MAAEPGLRHFVGRVLAALAVAGLALAAWQLAGVLLLVFGGVLLSVALRGAAEALAKRTPVPPRWGVLAVTLAMVLLLGGLVWLSGGQVAGQFHELTARIPEALGKVEAWLEARAWGRELVAILREAQPMREEALKRLGGVATVVVALIGNLLLILALTVYLALDPELYREGVVTLFPPDLRPRARQVLYALGDALRSWLAGQGLSMLVIGVLTTAGLLLLGMPQALALGLLAGLLEFVPYVGPVMSAIPALLMAFAQSPRDALYVLGLYLVIQQSENNIVLPLIQQRAVALPPVVTVAATVAMGVLFGFPGLLLATPLTVAAMVLVRLVYVEDLLGDRGL